MLPIDSTRAGVTSIHADMLVLADRQSAPQTPVQTVASNIQHYFSVGKKADDWAREFRTMAADIEEMLRHYLPKDRNSVKDFFVAIPEFCLNLCMMKVIFTQPGEHGSNPGAVSCTVTLDTESHTVHIDEAIFFRICTLLMVKKINHHLNFKKHLTEEGMINLYEANLSSADLRGINLRQADLEYADLSFTDLSYANMDKVTLGNAMLSGANLDHASLKEAYLGEVSLCFASMRQTNFFRANLNSADLTGCNLVQACLINAQLRYTNLTDAILTKTYLRDATLVGTTLSWNQLNKANFFGVKLSGAIITDIPPDGDLLELPCVWMTHHLNDILSWHVNASESNLLTTIASLDEKYNEIKLRMARQLIYSLKEQPLTPIISVVIDIFSKAPFDKDHEIVAWLNNATMNAMTVYNTSFLPNVDKIILQQLLTIFVWNPTLQITLNHLFIQTVFRSIASGREGLMIVAKCLYADYLQQSAVVAYTQLDEFGRYGDYAIDWEDPYAANFILFASQSNQVMLLSQHTLEHLLMPDTHNPVWNSYYLYQAPHSPMAQGDYCVETLFRTDFPLFYHSYQYALKQNCFFLVVDTLDLNEYRDVFLSATRKLTSTTKMVDGVWAKRLRDIFKPALHYCPSAGYNVHESHCQAIFRAYQIESASDADKAKMLLCLAAVFCQYASNYVFGKDTDSPEMIRFYANALMRYAYNLAPTQFANQGQYRDWEDRLLGTSEKFTCSAVIAKDMITHLKTLCPETLMRILPPAWY